MADEERRQQHLLLAALLQHKQVHGLLELQEGLHPPRVAAQGRRVRVGSETRQLRPRWARGGREAAAPDEGPRRAPSGAGDRRLLERLRRLWLTGIQSKYEKLA